VIHHYLPTRPGQRRGEPNAVRSLLGAHTFNSYEDAELRRKQTRAPFTGALYREAYAEADYRFDPFTGLPITVAGGSIPESALEAGTFLALAPGEKALLFDADDTGAGMAEYSRQVLLKICAGFGVPYEVATGDWKNVNDRLVRAINAEFRRSIEAAQDHLLIFQVCLGVWSWWMDAAVLSGALSAPGYATAWHDYQAVAARPHGWDYTNPLQDVQAKKLAMELRLTSR
jgi:lambda family phage portal protein